MRALLTDGSAFRLDASRPEPAPAPGDAVVRPTMVAAGGRELLLPGPGGEAAVGSEFVGVVESVRLPEAAVVPGGAQVGAGGPVSASVERWRRLKGRRVVGSPVISCQSCELCRSGLGGHCRARVVLGQGGRAGCFADRVIVPAGSLHTVPDGLSDERAIFAAPLAVAAHATALFRVEGKPYITVLGDGLLALLCVQVMARLNARVRLLGWRPERFGLCERWGIKHRHAGEVGRRHDQDVVIDASESSAGLTLALGLVRPRGRLILMGEGSRQGAGLPGEGLAQVVADEIELLGCRCGSIAEALAMLARGDVQTEALVARRARLDDAAMILNAPPAASDPQSPGLRLLVAA